MVKELFEPHSIVVIGASNELSKPGGRVLKHLIEGDFKGELFTLNPKEGEVQGIKCFKNPSELPNVDLAIIAIASKFVPDTIEYLVKNKNTKAFIVLSAGFSEIGEEGKKLEDKIVNICNNHGASLIGPNCVGVLTPSYKGAFTGPIPKLDSKGIDFVSGSGATAVFILEQAVPLGLTFASLFSVGNSAQIGVEDVLKHWDETFDSKTSSKVKMIYMEKIDKPDMLLKHASSLINKGCQIAAIKSGTTDAGSRAVSSHTGALAGSDLAVDTLFKKAGIVRCHSKQELVYISNVFMHKQLNGNRIAVITHAGGPGVMLTDTLAKNGMQVPQIKGEAAEELLTKLFHGSSVSNPIDFIATGTAEQLGIILDYVDNRFDNIDGSVVIFGTPGLFDVTEVYDVLNEKMNTCKKPIYPILPSIVQAKHSIEHFVSLGRQYFADEVVFGEALAKVYNTAKPYSANKLNQSEIDRIRNSVDFSKNGYLEPNQTQALLDVVNIPRVEEVVVVTKDKAIEESKRLGYPVVMKVVGPIHKTDVNGVRLFIDNDKSASETFDELILIKDAKAVMIQPMLKGTELFLGAKREGKFGHIILFGIGGIFIEVLKDFSVGLVPVGKKEANDMIKNLKAYDIIKGVRGQAGINEEKIADIILSLSNLLSAIPEISEMDINPLIARGDDIVAVDVRIKISD